MSTIPTNARTLAFLAQDGCCYYCERPMWQDDPIAYARQHGMTARQVRALRVTAEHLLARQDGGTNVQGNIVAAHEICNRRRHQRKEPLNPDAFKAMVARRLQQGAWFPSSALLRKAATLAKGS